MSLQKRRSREFRNNSRLALTVGHSDRYEGGNSSNLTYIRIHAVLPEGVWFNIKMFTGMAQPLCTRRRPYRSLNVEKLVHYIVYVRDHISYNNHLRYSLRSCSFGIRIILYHKKHSIHYLRSLRSK